jgi:hypothetical protein
MLEHAQENNFHTLASISILGSQTAGSIHQTASSRKVGVRFFPQPAPGRPEQPVLAVQGNLECHAISSAGVDCGRWSIWKAEESANPLGFGQWQREEPESTFALEAQWWAPFSEEFVLDELFTMVMNSTWQ